jgi:phosphatidylethanolamine/phosphatidyl-N-methylethanolamine N-methyltransferase
MAHSYMSKVEPAPLHSNHRFRWVGFTFARAWATHPLRVGAVKPSSRRLARLITSEITPAFAPVLELGAGTGVFTRSLLGRGLHEDQLVLVECDPFFAALLRHDYPKARIFQTSAQRMRHINLMGREQAGAVVSGLPLLSMSMRDRIAVLQFAFRHLRPGASFYQFTYGLRCPVPRPVLERFGLKAIRMGSTFLNAPPATVYRIRARPKRQ